MNPIELTGILYRDGDHVIAECPELGVSSYGLSTDDAKANLKEAVALYIETAIELGSWPEIYEQLKRTN